MTRNSKPDPFDAFMDAKAVQSRTSVAHSAPVVRDMLKIAWVAAQSVFGKAAKPEHAVMLLPAFIDAAAAERRLLLAEAAAQTEAAATPAPSASKAPRPTRRQS